MPRLRRKERGLKLRHFATIMMLVEYSFQNKSISFVENLRLLCQFDLGVFRRSNHT